MTLNDPTLQLTCFALKSGGLPVVQLILFSLLIPEFWFGSRIYRGQKYQAFLRSE